ncbi:unnamed protein product, partial [Rotaria sp. Silwood1]
KTNIYISQMFKPSVSYIPIFNNKLLSDGGGDGSGASSGVGGGVGGDIGGGVGGGSMVVKDEAEEFHDYSQFLIDNIK